MKIHLYTLLVVLLLLSYSGFSQGSSAHPVSLKSGTFHPVQNINEQNIDSINQFERIDGKLYMYIQFQQTPGAGERKMLSTAGIELLNYIPKNTYLAVIHNNLQLPLLKNVKAVSVFQLSPKQKMHPVLASGNFPVWSQKNSGTIELRVSFPKTVPIYEIQKLLKAKNIEISDQQFANYGVINLLVSKTRLLEVASYFFLEYLEPAPHPDQPLNFSSQAYSASRSLTASAAFGGKALDGDGVVVGIGDNANIISHVDFTNRVIDRAAVSTNETHGKHVSGTVAGAGIREEKNKGFAPSATIISQTFSSIIINSPAYVNDHNMVITNNSYGAVTGDCEYAGSYDLISYILDQQAIEMNSLQHVFASGNDGSVLCNPFPQGYQTVLGGFQSAKNVITVGGMNYNNSSKGPVKDGRLKPEIVALGAGIVSTANNNGYSTSQGTSNSTPAVSGGLALLYQQYRQQNGNADPKSGLMKALLCNGASDIGNAGPDYKNGFGLMNLNRSSDMLKKENYFISSVAHAGTNSYTINVPAGTGQIKVMLYWNDPSASGIAVQTLVNDLDLELHTPATSIFYPNILDATPSNVEKLAVQGVDRINNLEQVVINDPSPGNYEVKIKGTSINQNIQQEYFLVYDFIPVVPVLTFPIGGESFLPSENLLITWESPAPVSATFTIEVSMDNGATWISNQSNAGVRFYNWKLPNISSGQGLVRITDNISGQQVTSQPFTILGRPTVTLSATQCEGYINVSWTAVAGATQYEVMRLKNDKMVQEFLTPGTSTLQYSLKGLSKDSIYWVSVRAITNGKEGRRALAISRQPNNGNCNGSLSDYDLKIDSIISPKSGRALTSTALSSTENMIIRVKNLDNAVAPDFTVTYSLNGVPGSSQQITSGLAAGGFIDISFPYVNFSALGKYTILAKVTNNANTDPVPENDQLTVTISHLPNEALNLQSVFKDDVEPAVPKNYILNEVGLEGADRYDFQTSHPNNGRLRTFFSSGIAYSGKNAFTLDASNYTNPAVKNLLTGTYNLVNYDTAVDDIRLDFLFKQHGQYANTGNRVWIRGNDNPATPWIEVYDLSANQTTAGIFKRSSSLEIADLLQSNGQDFTSSFQVRWGQEGVVMASDNTRGNGYTFDDIQLYKAIDDIQLLSIDEPVSVDCNLGNVAIVAVSVRNSANHTISNIPIRLKVNNGATISEIIPQLTANQTFVYHFTTPVDLSTFGHHQVISWVDFATDNYRFNDTAKLALTNSPVINSFPHIQDFEMTDGYWYTNGANNSWAYGTPASTKINSAASGNKAWKTNLAGNYNDNEHSYLYSPCFDISGLDNPALSFSMAIDMEDCGATLCDVVYVEYSTDGKTWERLGDLATGTNWYNRSYIGSLAWSVADYTRWHAATVSLPAGLSNLRLRFVLKSDPGVNKEGVAIDDIHIYSNSTGIYDGLSMNAPVVQPAAGNEWVHFSKNGQLVASVLPSQNLGNTEVQAFINEGSVRSQFNQYYHDRNITIKSVNPITQPAKVRFYFTDKEVEDLLNASDCNDCSKPGSSYELGVTKYTDSLKNNENGTMADNNNGNWKFIIPGDVKIVPFDIGYYAEFEVNEFSECWLNNGGPGKAAPIPVGLSEFTVQKQNEVDVKLEWSTDTEIEMDRFEIELAKGIINYQSNQFQMIGTVKALGSPPNNYSYLDNEPNKNTVRYYRLKMITENGFYMYSPVKSVMYGAITAWKILPNPSFGIFNLQFNANPGEKVSMQLTDALGRVLKKYDVIATGFDQQQNIDITESIYPAGIYLLRVESANQKKVFKIIKK